MIKLNILWFILGGGVIAFLLWALASLILAATVIGIPFAFAAFRIAKFAAFPFGKEMVDAKEQITGTTLANILWIILAGIWLFISHIAAGAALFVTIIGIPFGWAHFKIAFVSFAPLGKQIVSSEQAEK
ncbi:MAG: YccF domain-containing protein [Gammaproteobacteria bacterium]|nr:YccF domain-containing protein [Gammaproteobacteria bacterium]